MSAVLTPGRAAALPDRSCDPGKAAAETTAIDATFDPKDHGHASFGEMLKALDALVEVRKGEADHQLRLNP
jgi:hypothetical protein